MGLYVDEKTLRRFWSKVDRNGPIPQHAPDLGPCWVWTAYSDCDGYGRFRCGVNHRAHRFSWMVAHGHVAATQWVLHHCDTPPCCNPRHMFVGTPADNVRDMDQKGRRVDRRGGRNPRARLTETSVRDIRRRYAEGGITLHALDSEYGMRRGCSAAVVSRQTWGHIE